MKSIYALIFFLCCCGILHAQVGIGTTTPNANAVLELKSPGNNQGFLTPRLTTAQRTAISLTAAENGLLVYDTDESKFYYWQVSQWLPLRSGNDVALAAGAGIDITNNTVSAIPDGDGDATNEIQDLQMVGNTLSITNNANATGIDLAPFAGTNTDNQTLSYNTTTAALSITGGNTVTVSLVDNSVTTAKINNLAVTTAKIANDAITSAKITDGTITSADLSTSGVTAGTYGNATSVPQFAVDSKGRVTSALNVTISGTLPGGNAGGVLTGTYPDPGLANNAVAAANISDLAVTTAKINDLAVATAKLNDLAVTTGKIANDAINSAKISDGTITSADLADNAVTNAKIADAAVSTAEIANGAVTVGKISPSGINGQVLTTVGGVTTWSTPASAVTSITAGTGLSGGTITGTGTIALTNTLGNSVTVGSSTEIPVLSINQQGRITSVTTATVSGGGGDPEGLDKTLAVNGDAKDQPAYNLSSVSIGDWGSKGPGQGALNVNGSHYRSFVTISADYTVKNTDYIILGKPETQKPIAVLLPDPAKIPPGRILIVRSLATSAEYCVVLKVDGGLIDEASESEKLFYVPNSGNTAYSLTVMSDGKAWWTIDRAVNPAGK